MSAVYPRPVQAVRASALPMRLAMLAILLAAFALRAYRLDFQSLWSDEGISLLRSSQPLAEMLRNMPVEHTPGYFVLLHWWLALAGSSDIALRWLSLLPSVLAVALIFRFGISLGSAQKPYASGHHWVAAVAALLLATSGFQIWYAQEARMYAWLLAAALASCLAQWQVLERPADCPTRHANWWAVLYALSTAGVVYLHLFGALLPVAQAVYAAGWLAVRRDLRPFARWALAAAAALLLFLPWLPHTLGIFGFEGWRQGGDAGQLPWRYWLAYTISDGLAAPWRSWLPWLYVALAIGGAVYWWRVRVGAAAYLLVTLLAPWAAALALAVRNPDYHERYTIYLAAPLLLLVAGGLGLLDLRPYRAQARGLPTSQSYWLAAPALLLAALLVIGNGLAVQRLYTDASLHKPDYRAAAERIAAHLQPGDVVLVDGPDPEKVFKHYFKADAPVYAVGYLQDAAYDTVGKALAPLLQGAGRVWEVLYFHPPAAVQVWLATQAWATDPTEHNGIRVLLYGLPQDNPQSHPLDISFGPALTLQSADTAPAELRPGDLLRVSTHWFVNQQLPEYKFSLRLANAAGEPVYTVDYVPQNWFAPTNVWVVGQPATDQRGILLPDDLPPGTYNLTLRLYDPATGAPIDSSAGQDILLADLQIGETQP
ncbi:MAG: glycosyltransferase family 39 protein [Caldilineaceae bacterium]